MIEWDITRTTYGDVDLNSYRPKVVVKCDRCSKISLYTIRVKKKIIDNQISWLCYKCACNKENVRQKHSIQLTEQWKDEDYKNARKVCSKKLWENKEYRDKIIDLETKYWSDLTLRKRLSELYINKYSDSDYRNKQRQNSILLWNDPIYVKKMMIFLTSDKNRDNMRNLANRLWADEQYRNKMAEVRLKMPKTSNQQKILYSILDDLGIKYYDDQAIESKIGYYTFDCRIDPQNNINIKNSILIEVQGDYWHSLKKAVRNDMAKATYIMKYFSNYQLKYLWEHEFIAKNRIQEVIKYWLGIYKHNLIDFKFDDLSYKIIQAYEAEMLISKYHYSGKIGRSGLNIGFFLGEQLIATVVYSHIIRKECATKQGMYHNEVLELSRFCIDPKFQHKNLASYIISHSIRLVKNMRPNIKLLIAFADSTYNHVGSIYKSSNWILDGETKSDYWYVDSNGYVCHKKTIWNKANQMKMTEQQYINTYDYVKVWGGKKYRYSYKI